MYHQQPSEQTIEKATQWLIGLQQVRNKPTEVKGKEYRFVPVYELTVGDCVRLNPKNKTSAKNSAVLKVVGITDCGEMRWVKFSRENTIHSFMLWRDFEVLKDFAGGRNA